MIKISSQIDTLLLFFVCREDPELRVNRTNVKPGYGLAGLCAPILPARGYPVA
jgi:hypothetical protein